jgi:O-antigen/teichoic acid export membrane protein
VRLRDLARLVAPTPHDTSSAEGRSAERLRRAALTGAASIGGRVLTTLTLLISVPLTLNYLGEERYGMWVTLSSIIAMLALADFGVGYGMMNRVAAAHGRSDHEGARAAIAGGFYILLAIAGVFALALGLGAPTVGWHRLYQVGSAAAVREAAPATVAFALCFLVGLPLSVIARVREAYQEGFVNALFNAGGALLALLSLVLAVRARASLPVLVLAVAGVPLVTAAANGIWLFGRQRPWLRPRWASLRAGASSSVVGLGSLFFLLQAEAAITFGSDPFIAAQVLGPAAVTHYSVPARLFNFPFLLLTLVLAPLWPAYAEAVARGDRSWVRRTLGRSLLLAFGAALVAAVVLVLGARPILRLWLGHDMAPSRSLILGLGCATVLLAVGEALGVFLNGLSALRFQAVCGAVMAACAIPVKVMLARRYGVGGLVWGTVAVFGLFSALPLALYARRLLRDLARAPAAPGDIARAGEG